MEFGKFVFVFYGAIFGGAVTAQFIVLIEFVLFHVLKYSHCRVLPGHYNYSVIFGFQANSCVLSTVLLTASFLLVRKNQSYGQSGIYQASQKTWTTVTSTMLVLALSLLLSCLIAVAASNMEDIGLSLIQDIINYSSNVSSEIDSIQSHFRCCGVDGPESWQLNWKYNCNSTNGVCGVPQSCCIANSNWACGFGVRRNETLNCSNVYKGGCQMALEECIINVSLSYFSIFISVFYVTMFFPLPRKKFSSRDRWYFYALAVMSMWRSLTLCFTCLICKLYKTGSSQEETLEQNSYIRRQGIQSEQELLLPVTLTADEAEEDMPTTAKEISQTILSSENRIAPIGELSLTVGPDGGYAHRGDLSLFVPAGAVGEEVTLLAKVYIDKQVFPPVDISKEQFIFSPVLSLEPHDYRFKQPVLVRLPFSAVPGGWHLSLLKADCQVEEDARAWKEIVSYNTDTGEVTTDGCQYDVEHAWLSLSHFCRHFWCAKALSKEGRADSNPRKILLCSIYGISDGSLNRWHLELNLHDRCDDMSETISENYRRLDLPWKLFGYRETLTIARRGEIRCEVISRIWQLTETIQVIGQLYVD